MNQERILVVEDELITIVDTLQALANIKEGMLWKNS